MNTITEIIKLKADAFSEPYLNSEGVKDGFMAGVKAAMDLQLPGLFVEWKDKNCRKIISHDKLIILNDPYKQMFTYEELYQYFLQNIYSPEQVK